MTQYRGKTWSSPEGAMTVTKLATFAGHDFCWCGCRQPLGANGQTAIRAATHVVTILGHDTMLCSGCAKKWRESFEAITEVAV